MSKEGCELCGKPARMFCESDQASLCWDCDERVHAANFLVAKHCRTLLCHVCSSPTQWTAAGLKLSPTVSVCHTCAEDGIRRGVENRNQVYDSQESESDDVDSDYYSEEEEEEEEEGGEEEEEEGGEEEEEEEEEDEDEDGENQVVPWSICSSAPPAPTHTAVSSFCSSGDDDSFSSLKRMRENPFESETEDGCSSSQNLDSKLASSDFNFQDAESNDSSGLSLFRPLKVGRTNNAITLIPSERVIAEQTQVNSSSAIVHTLRKFQQQMVSESKDASAMILGICKLTRDS